MAKFYHSLNALLLSLIVVVGSYLADGFMTPQPSQVAPKRMWSASNSRSPLVVLREAGDDDESMENTEGEEKTATKVSLEEKMKSWEASEEELKAASLGGNIPQRTDGFDIGLYIAFPIMIVACLLFLAFPFIAGNLDVDSVGPPPTS